MKFEDLIAWQKARILVTKIYEVTRRDGFKYDFGLVSQMQRASVSIMSNIAEGHERDGSTEFYRFLHIAKGSCAEVRSGIYTAFDAGYISKNDFQLLLSLAEEVTRIIGGLRRSIKDRKEQARRSRPSSVPTRPSSLVSRPSVP